MTIYRVLYGLLFLGICSDVIKQVDDQNTAGMAMAFALFFLALNDLVGVTWFLDIRGKAKDVYNLGLCWCDILGFVCLAWAHITLHPESDNRFRVAVKGWLRPNADHLACWFWGLAAGYWLFGGVIWNLIARPAKVLNAKTWPSVVHWTCTGLVMVCLIVSAILPDERWRWGTVVVVIAYVVVFRSWIAYVVKS